MSDIKTVKIPKLGDVSFTFMDSIGLKANEPFADELFGSKGAISMVSIKVKADKDIKLSLPGGNATNQVTFGLGGNAFTALGVYRKTNALSEALKSDGMSEPIAKLLDLKIADDENLLALRWGYGFNAAIAGSVALMANPVKITFGVDAQKTGLFTLLHKTKRSESVKDSVTETLKSWRIPKQIKSTDDLEPNTTIVMETLGELKTKIGVQYGFDYSWIRDDLKIGELAGDLDVKINASINAQFGFSALGRYAVAMGRETDEKIRFQVFKLNEKGMSFAFNGGISGQANIGGFPSDLDSLVKGIFNLNGSQVLKDFEKWFDEDTSLEELLSDKLFEEAKDLVKSVTGIDPDQELEKATAKFRELIGIWKDLPAKLNSLVYDLLPGDLTDLSNFLKTVTSFSGSNTAVSDKIVDEIEKHIEDIDFYKTPIGKWLMEMAGGEITSLIANFDGQRTTFLDLAQKTSKLLDGSEVEDRLKNLQKYIDEKLNLDKIEDLANTDKWLKERLRVFLGKQTIVTKDLESIRKVVNKLREKSKMFYSKAYEAMTKKYGVEIDYKFQKTTTRDALIDLTFDFSTGTKTTSKKHLKDALDGEFEEILTKQIPGIKLNSAVLTHGINRSSNLSITLPFKGTNISHINNSISKLEISDKSDGIIDESGGRLWLFSLAAEDTWKRDGDNQIKLAITSQWALEINNNANIRSFGGGTHKISQSVLYADFETSRVELNSRYGLSASAYFRSDISSFSAYLTTVDKSLDKLSITDSDNFGSTLSSLSLGLDGRVLSVWKKFKRDYDDDSYKKISLAVQKRLREWIPKAFIREPMIYDKEKNVSTLLLYQSLPLFSEFVEPRPWQNELDTNLYHWNYSDKDTKMNVFENHCRSNLVQHILPNVQELIDGLPIEDKLKEKIREKYDVSNIEKIKKLMEKTSSDGKTINSLSKFERKIIGRIVETAQSFQNFLDNKNDSKKGLEALAEFGKVFTQTFNTNLGHNSYIPDGSLRPLGLIIMSDIAKILDSTLDDLKISAIFDLYVLEPTVTKAKFKGISDKFFEGTRPEGEGLIALQQRIINKNTPLIY